MKKYINSDFIKIIISLLLMISTFMISNDNIKIIVLITSYIIISYEMYIESFQNIIHGEIFDENFLMIIATIGAFIIKSYTEGVMVILLYQIGEYLSDLAVSKSKKSILDLMNLKVETIELEDKRIIPLKDAKKGDIFIIKPGDTIPLDGIVMEGESYLDTSKITGESIPKKVDKNSNVFSGCINQQGKLKIKATSDDKTSTTSKIIELMEKSNEKKSDTETFMNKFSKIYTPTVVGISILITLIPVILGQEIKKWLYRSLIFLVTSCPCALVISIPLVYFCGIGKASKEGVLIKGAKELEKISKTDYIILDKTGTITKGNFVIKRIQTKMNQEEFLQYMASLEEYSNHPIADIIKNSNKKELLEVKNYKEESGKGIEGTVNNKRIIIGTKTYLEENNIKIDENKEAETTIYLAIENKYQGYIVLGDEIKENSYQLSNLKDKEIIILSGDKKESVESIAKSLKIKTFYGELLPHEKVEKVKEYQKLGKVMFIGDGVNDAPVISTADVGASLGKMGTDAALEASDIVFMHDDLSKIETAFQISEKTNKKCIENVILALTIKAIVLLLGVFGYSTIIMAVFADVGVTLLVILNSIMLYKR